MHEKIKPNNAKNDVTPTVKLAIHKDLTFEDTKQTSQNRVVVVKEPRHMEKHYEGSNILFWNLEPTPSLHRFVLTFLPFIMDL